MLPTSPAFPDTAVAGETLAARFAGACAARKTVTIPITAPDNIPGTLTPNTGIFSHSPPTIYFSPAQIIQETTTPRAVPTGTALLHQFNASSLTIRTIWLRLAPMQRSIPKNCVLRATLLFMLPEIIITPAARIMTNRTPARGYTF